MNADRFYTIEKTINGVDYVAQFNGLSTAFESVERCYIDGTNTVSQLKLSKYLLENILVEPKGLTVDDFDTLDELNEVIAFLSDVMKGNFRKKKNQSTAKKGSKG